MREVSCGMAGVRQELSQLKGSVLLLLELKDTMWWVEDLFLQRLINMGALLRRVLAFLRYVYLSIFSPCRSC